MRERSTPGRESGGDETRAARACSIGSCCVCSPLVSRFTTSAAIRTCTRSTSVASAPRSVQKTKWSEYWSVASSTCVKLPSVGAAARGKATSCAWEREGPRARSSRTVWAGGARRASGTRLVPRGRWLRARLLANVVVDALVVVVALPPREQKHVRLGRRRAAARRRGVVGAQRGERVLHAREAAARDAHRLDERVRDRRARRQREVRHERVGRQQRSEREQDAPAEGRQHVWFRLPTSSAQAREPARTLYTCSMRPPSNLFFCLS